MAACGMINAMRPHSRMYSRAARRKKYDDRSFADVPRPDHHTFEALASALLSLLIAAPHVPVCEPWRVPDNDIRFLSLAGEPDGTGQVAGDISPNVIAAFALQPRHKLVGFLENVAVVRRDSGQPFDPGAEVADRPRQCAELDHRVEDPVEEPGVRRHRRRKTERRCIETTGRSFVQGDRGYENLQRASTGKHVGLALFLTWPSEIPLQRVP